MITLTVIIRDEAPVRHLNEPCEYRSVHIVLTPEQERFVQLRPDEAISHCFFEPSTGRPATCDSTEAA